MRAYKITATDPVREQVLATRVAGTNALAREARDELMAQTDLKKKDVVIEELEIPTPKPELLAYINELFKQQDAGEEEAE